jgi:phosphohistidine phosphatase SixA
MLSPEYYDSCADVILAHYAKLEDDILCDIIRRLMKTGIMTDSAKHQAEMLQQAGLLYEDIIREIAARTDTTAKHVQAVFEDAGVETVEIDNTVYRDMGNIPVDIRQSDAMRQVLEAGFRKTLGDVQNLTLTTAVTSQTAYKAACNSAYMQVSSGAFDYQTAIRNAIRQAAVQGCTILYPSGHVSQLDVAIRRSVLTGIGQTCREIGLANAEENGCDLMEITAHSGARPEHARWQGQLVDRSGKLVGEVIDGMRVFSLREIGYGDVKGFGGANCRHDWYPYFVGYSTPNYTQEELEKLNERSIEYNGNMYTQYEISQMQRAGERKIRKLKRETVAYDTAAKNAPDSVTELEMKNAFQVTSVKLKDAEKQVKDFCKETGQDRDRFREQTLGFARSQAQSGVRANKKALT